MNRKIELLDCTLRDGGYCNYWRFGTENIPEIIAGLRKAKIEMIECGFLTDRVDYDEERTLYTQIEQADEMLRQAAALCGENIQEWDCMPALMINVGEYDVGTLPAASETKVKIIRLAFHKKNMDNALRDGGKIKELGYNVFLQPMVSMGYTDEEFLKLIEKANRLVPYAFYIVDSFGMMKEKDLLRYFMLAETNLNKGICLGFHPHNNLQLAYANSRKFIEMDTERRLILDVSVMGMGRGAGNLNGELMVSHMNEYFGKDYVLKPLLRIIDEILNVFYKKRYWGYSLPNYLAAVYRVHPNYAMYLEEKQTLTLENMEDILKKIDGEKAVSFDKHLIEKLYVERPDEDLHTDSHLREFVSKIKGAEALIIAPGRSAAEQAGDIIEFAARSRAVTFSVNFCYPYMTTDYVFISNQRRFKDLAHADGSKIIVTSNIHMEHAFIRAAYSDLLVSNELVEDNAVLMLIQFLYRCGAAKVVLAGMDGYSYHPDRDYINSKMEIISEIEAIDEKNKAIRESIEGLSKKIPISTVTAPKYIHIHDYVNSVERP